MAEYRIFLMDAAEHIVDRIELFADNDEHALAKAARISRCPFWELWERDRLVYSVLAEPSQ